MGEIVTVYSSIINRISEWKIEDKWYCKNKIKKLKKIYFLI